VTARDRRRLEELRAEIDTARSNLDRLIEQRTRIWQRLVAKNETPAAIAEVSGVTPAAVRLKLRKS